MLRTIAVSVTVSVVAFGLGGCVKNEATGKSILTLGMSRDQEIALGGQAMPEMVNQYGGKVEDAALQQYVTNIGAKMAKETEAQNPSLPWEFTLLNTDVVNAFALPGGKVFFTRGLAEKLTTEAEMAGVLGHEIGHVTAQHGAQRIASQTVLSGISSATAVAVSTSSNSKVQQYGALAIPAVSMGGSVVLLKYGRDEELEADRLGVRYMANVGYDPRGQLEVMKVLQQLSAGSSQPEFLSTHPDPAARVQQIEGLLTGQYAYTQNSAQYQDFKDRYKTEFLDVIKKMPPAPKPKASLSVPQNLAVGDPTSWCPLCRGASVAATQGPEAGPVPPREGVYAFFAPAAAK